MSQLRLLHPQIWVCCEDEGYEEEKEMGNIEVGKYVAIHGQVTKHD